MNEYLYAAMNDNLQAMTEISQRDTYMNERVRVVKGRKVPHGTEGVVVWLKRVHYGQGYWNGWDTRIGIETNDGERVFTSLNNVELV